MAAKDMNGQTISTGDAVRIGHIHTYIVLDIEGRDLLVSPIAPIVGNKVSRVPATCARIAR